MVTFNKSSCPLCRGTGFYTPGPYYNRRKKCDHRYSKNTWEQQLTDTEEKMKKSKAQYNALVKIDKERVC